MSAGAVKRLACHAKHHQASLARLAERWKLAALLGEASLCTFSMAWRHKLKPVLLQTDKQPKRLCVQKVASRKYTKHGLNHPKIKVNLVGSLPWPTFLQAVSQDKKS